jgi:hypothetical protein
MDVALLDVALLDVALLDAALFDAELADAGLMRYSVGENGKGPAWGSGTSRPLNPNAWGKHPDGFFVK